MAWSSLSVTGEPWSSWATPGPWWRPSWRLSWPVSEESSSGNWTEAKSLAEQPWFVEGSQAKCLRRTQC